MIRSIKRLICVCVAAAMLLSLAGCKKEAPEVENSKTISVYSTFYPLHALTEKITDDVEGIRTMCLVQPQDGCLRDYSLSDWDLALLLRSADAVISGGRGLESFENTLFALGENGPAVSAVLYNMDLDTAKASGIPEGEESHWNDANPHIYMSVDGAAELAKRIAASMQALDPEYAEDYKANCQDAETKLGELKARMQDIAQEASGVKVAILNEALWYFAKNFDVKAMLCYHRESGENIDNTAVLIEEIKNSGAKVVLIEKQAPYALTEALEGAGLSVAKIDILSTHRAEDGFEGYPEAQISNAQALQAACAKAAQK